MATRAKISIGWKVRLGGMAALFLGYAAYFIYDGFVGYPAQNKIRDEFRDFKEKNATADAADQKWRETWDEKYAPDRGLPPSKEAEKIDHSPGSILTQKILGFGLIPIGAFGAWCFAGAMRRWVEADDAGVRTSDGQSTSFENITKLDKKLWPKKGIAWLYYKDGQDRAGSDAAAAASAEKRILIDDFKFDREPTDKIMRLIEDKLPDEKIVNDIRETERDRRKAEKAAKEKEEQAAAQSAG